LIGFQNQSLDARGITNVRSKS